MSCPPLFGEIAQHLGSCSQTSQTQRPQALSIFCQGLSNLSQWTYDASFWILVNCFLIICYQLSGQLSCARLSLISSVLDLRYCTVLSGVNQDTLGRPELAMCSNNCILLKPPLKTRSPNLNMSGSTIFLLCLHMRLNGPWNWYWKTHLSK